MPVLAIMPGQMEWVVLLVLGLLLFGRRLPEVGRALGRTVADFRRGLDDFKREVDKDGSVREARSGLANLKRAIDAPRVATDPRRLLSKLAETPAAEPGDVGDRPAAAEPSRSD